MVPADATDTRNGRRVFNELVPEPLMIPLAIIGGDKLGNGPAKMTLAEWNDAVEAFLLNRTGESRAGCANHSVHDASVYSRSNPPRRSRRWTRPAESYAGVNVAGTGAGGTRPNAR